MKRAIIIINLLFAAFIACAQDTALEHKKWELNGYVKDMETVSFDRDYPDPITNNLFHNRINLKWKPNKLISGSLEIRNRIFWGDMVRNTPRFADLLRNENEWLNLSAIWVNRSNFVMHSNWERLWVEIGKKQWNARVGRQRINWGLTTTWNPNDIFNTYNFLDFDYEERPGSDAAKLQYVFNDQSSLEVAVSVANDNRSIAAARYFINRWGYDLQIIAGKYQNKLTGGFGWAGNIGNIGYKAEAQAFIAEKDSLHRFNYSMELNYMFRNGWYVSGSVLHNTSGINEPVINRAKINFRLSPIDLMPARWSFITITSREITPLFSANLTLVYSPRVNLFIIYPSLKYNLLTNLDADLIYQSFFLELQEKFKSTSHNVFLRLKWNF